MGFTVDPSILGYMAHTARDCTLLVDGSAEPAKAVGAVRAARSAVAALRHPDDPEEALPASMTPVEETGDGACFTVDLADAETYGLLEKVLGVMVAALADAGLADGRLTCRAPAPTGLRLPADDVPGAQPALPVAVQRLLVSPAGGEAAAGYLVAEGPEELMGYFEATLPGVLLSFELHHPDEPSYGLVVFRSDDALGIVTVRDTGEARSVEVSVHTDTAVVTRLLARLQGPLPPGAQVRFDRRDE